MIFPSVETLLIAYQQHARIKRFSVARCSSRKGKDGCHKYQTITCDRGRKSISKGPSKRIQCPTRLSVVLKKGVWTETRVSNNHNHALDPKMTRMMPSHRNLTLEMKRNLEANDIAGIRPSKSIRLLEVQKGDCRNFFESNRRLRLGKGDAHAIQNLFMKLQQEERDFFYLIDTDVEGRLANVLWVHPRCKAAYEEFHDVCFGCALISYENISLFKWLFSTWLDAMGEVMPNTRHHFYLWHIMQKVSMKFSHITEFDSAILEFKKLVYESHTISEFERQWNEFIKKYSLENNQWLSNLYKERENWASVYLDHFFWADMVPSQRSESMHAYFDDYIHHGSTFK
ncbi:protein far-red impaired response 1 [Phtheirospermum japonicum]|uniref:Protein FAR1-RELATED SEQUENCE n=1 Tax=Phtheirospermum japonicum TaxID=374723 RepID=A0A830D2K7_9LAMI|nr:protein far-red impaired response 1 [Phtheirospermum japonicum]